MVLNDHFFNPPLTFVTSSSILAADSHPRSRPALNLRRSGGVIYADVDARPSPWTLSCSSIL